MMGAARLCRAGFIPLLLTGGMAGVLPQVRNTWVAWRDPKSGRAWITRSR